MKLQAWRLLAAMIGAACLGALVPSARAQTAEAQTYYMFVLNDAAPGKEAEFNRWYDELHAQDVLVNPDYVSSRRYAVGETQLQPGAKGPTKYLIAFKIETKDIARALEYIHANIRSGYTVQTDSIATGSGVGGDLTYKALTGFMPGKGPAGAQPQSHLLLVFAEAAPGKEKAFDEWYDKVHGPAVAALPGVTGWQRFEQSPVQLTPRRMSITRPYMTAYWIEADAPGLADLQGRLKALEAQGPGDAGTIGAVLTYRAIGPLLLGEDIKKERVGRLPKF